MAFGHLEDRQCLPRLDFSILHISNYENWENVATENKRRIQ